MLTVPLLDKREELESDAVSVKTSVSSSVTVVVLVGGWVTVK